MIIEPCCYQKQFMAVFTTAKQRGYATYVTNSDTTVHHLMSWLLAYMPMADITIAMPTITEPTMRMLEAATERSFYDQTELKERPLIRQLNIIAQSYPDMTSIWFEKSLSQVTIAQYPLGFRAILIKTDYDIRVENGKAIKVPGRKFLVQGSINQDISRAMQMVTVTTDADHEEMTKYLSPIIKLHKMFSFVHTSP